jgi:hypothetical protein
MNEGPAALLGASRFHSSLPTQFPLHRSGAAHEVLPVLGLVIAKANLLFLNLWRLHSDLFHSSPTASIELEQHESILFLGLVAAKTNLLSLNIWRLRSKIFLYSREKWPPTQKILWFSSEPRTARFDCLTPERKVQFREVVGVML